ncbi:peptidoglycan DD-metalloendopeptidase family protein [Spirochaeta lutea]|uniref:peptidoglycan DD-metalloendopeptidase family protein n=1 Tax=Spirochaeta lutea TaxID=1480694 RepID=UPI000691D8B7|nr:peptidoglycan DD-metalloendopeptidase family protein [Spirochaeta lutea]
MDIAERFGYNGKLLVEATGLYDYGYRHYAPTTARFTTVDPIKDGPNWYVYVGNDPVNFVDPLGLLSDTPGNGQAEELAPSPFLAPVINGMAYPVGMKNGSDYPAGYDYGPREPITTPIGVTDNFHDGIDITAPEGTRANAVGDGVVTYTGTDTIFGNYITIQHPNGTSTLYAHLKDNFVEDGDDVQAGQHIGNVGQTGQATGSHLHLGYDANGDGDFGDQWIDNPTVLIGSSP